MTSRPFTTLDLTKLGPAPAVPSDERVSKMFQDLGTTLPPVRYTEAELEETRRRGLAEVDSRSKLLQTAVDAGLVRPAAANVPVTRKNFDKKNVLEVLGALGQAVTLAQRSHVQLSTYVQSLSDDQVFHADTVLRNLRAAITAQRGLDVTDANGQRFTVLTVVDVLQQIDQLLEIVGGPIAPNEPLAGPEVLQAVERFQTAQQSAASTPPSPSVSGVSSAIPPSAEELARGRQAPAGAPENLITDFGFKPGADHPRVVRSVEARPGVGLAYGQEELPADLAGSGGPTPIAASVAAPTLTERVAQELAGSPQAVVPTATPEQNQRAADLERTKAEELRRHFRGSGSILARYLSPDIIANGKGAFKPGRAGLKEYQEDASQIQPEKLVSWPLGFYRNKSTSHMQLMVPTPQAIVIVEGLPSDSGRVTFHFRNAKVPNGWESVPLEQLSVTQLMQFASLVEAVLSRHPLPTAEEMRA